MGGNFSGKGAQKADNSTSAVTESLFEAISRPLILTMGVELDICSTNFLTSLYSPLRANLILSSNIPSLDAAPPDTFDFNSVTTRLFSAAICFTCAEARSEGLVAGIAASTSAWYVS